MTLLDACKNGGEKSWNHMERSTEVIMTAAMGTNTSTYKHTKHAFSEIYTVTIRGIK